MAEGGVWPARDAPSSAGRVVLVAGASGSGKSRLARHAHCLHFRLDDFYRDADHPGHVLTDYGIIDWDDPASWDAEAAVAALGTLIDDGEVEVPVYSITESRAVGRHSVRLLAGAGDPALRSPAAPPPSREPGPPRHNPSPTAPACIVAEGVFAIELLPLLRRAGIPAQAIYLDRPGLLVSWLRLRRDLALKRKPPLVLLRRGWALWRSQPALKRKAVAAGFTPLRMRAALAAVQHRVHPPRTAGATPSPS